MFYSGYTCLEGSASNWGEEVRRRRYEEEKSMSHGWESYQLTDKFLPCCGLHVPPTVHNLQLGVIARACNLSTWRKRQEGWCKLQARQDYPVRNRFRNTTKGVEEKAEG